MYATLSVDESSDYDTLKTALLKSCDLHEEGYRRKFQEAKLMITETASRLLRNYSTISIGGWKCPKWIGHTRV